MTAGVVVAGAGRNSLIDVGYLTRAGYRCRVHPDEVMVGAGREGAR
jgi:hypothetical protein